MLRAGGQSNAIRWFILVKLGTTSESLSSLVSTHFNITRQAAHYHLKQLIGAGIVERVGGPTRQAKYRLKAVQVHQRFPIVPTTAEDEIWRTLAEPCLRGLPRNVHDICFYGFTEMVNNVIDHSEAGAVVVEVSRGPTLVTIAVTDYGVGIFHKIQRAFGLDSTREALFELSKGKLTTDPSRHTGEGVFFSSRAFDRFSILAGELFLTHSRDEPDWLLEGKEEPQAHGTRVHMAIDPATTHTLEEVFQQYSTPQADFGFNRTTIALKLAEKIDGPMISRSQAKRVVARLDRFKEVVLDFEDVESIGPAFADQIFRVFQRANPAISLLAVNTNEAVAKMIAKATATPEIGAEEG